MKELKKLKSKKRLILLAKSDRRETIMQHAIKTADMATKILTNSMYESVLESLCDWLKLSREDVITLVKYLAATHDIGKCHPFFQRIMQILTGEYADNRNLSERYRHEKGSEAIARRIWQNLGLFTDSEIDAFSAVLRIHHQNRVGKNYATNKAWQELQESLEQEIREWAGMHKMEINTTNNFDVACETIASIIILSDRIASSEGPEKSFKALDLGRKEPISKKTFEQMYSFPPRPLQKSIVEYFDTTDKIPLFLCIEGLMGEGKTEAAMYAARIMAEYWRKNGIYYGAPTTASANQLCKRIKDILGENVDLMHGTSWMEEDLIEKALYENWLSQKGPEKDDALEELHAYQSWKTPKKKGLLSQYAVGTIDQLLMSVLKVKFSNLRRFGLTNKVLILDEIHSYDAYTSRLIERLLDFCESYRIPVIMLSATLPAEVRKRFMRINCTPSNEYPLLTAFSPDKGAEEVGHISSFRTSRVKMSLMEGLPAIPDEGCTCIIVNTVKKAQEIYLSLDNDCPKMLFHGKMTVAKKREIEKKVEALLGKDGSNRPKKFILVATQVVEQSLDIDFDYLITELAPIDLILQRIGRLHRHKRKRPKGLEKPQCVVFHDGDLGSGIYVYAELILIRTLELLQKIKSISLPKDVRLLIEEVYKDDISPEEYEKAMEMYTDIRIQKAEADFRIHNKPANDHFSYEVQSNMYDDDDKYVSAMTRLGNDSSRLCILPERLYIAASEGTDKHNVSAKIAKEIYEYSTPIGTSQIPLEAIKGTGRLAGCYFLQADSGEKPTDTLISGKIRIDSELGLIIDTKRNSSQEKC